MSLVGAAPGPTDTMSRLKSALGAVLLGKDDVVELALCGILAGGHILLQDVPGVGKTTLAQGLAEVLGGSFARVQFTADLLPSDIVGVGIYERSSGEFRFKPGPVFANVVLADEINRTTPKTQSALFEAMEEGQVTVDGKTWALPKPFVVVATQNPFDHHGTFALPDSQLDRFLLRISVGYPDRDHERLILRMGQRSRIGAGSVLELDTTRSLIAQAAAVRVSGELEDYVLDLVRATRTDGRFVRGVSPRGGQALMRAVRALALVRGRTFAIPEDVRTLGVPVFGHRVLVRGGGVAGEGGAAAVRALIDELPGPC